MKTRWCGRFLKRTRCTLCVAVHTLCTLVVSIPMGSLYLRPLSTPDGSFRAQFPKGALKTPKSLYYQLLLRYKSCCDILLLSFWLRKIEVDQRTVVAFSFIQNCDAVLRSCFDHWPGQGCIEQAFITIGHFVNFNPFQFLLLNFKLSFTLVASTVKAKFAFNKRPLASIISSIQTLEKI